jgi:hypothetical protein
MRTSTPFFAIAALVAASVPCGDVVRESRSPAILVVNSLQAAPGARPNALAGNLLSDVITNVTSPAPCTPATPCPTIFNDVAQVVFTLAMKDITVAPTTNNQVTLNRVHIEYTRADGRNVPGVDVPYAIDAALTGTVTPGTTGSVGFEIVRSSAKQESPLVQLISSGALINTIARLTFYGKDAVGNDVSATAQIQINFGNFGDQ